MWARLVVSALGQPDRKPGVLTLIGIKRKLSTPRHISKLPLTRALMLHLPGVS